MTRDQAKREIKAFIDYFNEECEATPVCLEYAIKSIEKLENIELIIQSVRDESEDPGDAFYEICKEVEE